MHPSSISCHFTTKVVNVPSQDIKNFNYGYGEPTKRLSSGLVMARRRDAGNDIVVSFVVIEEDGSHTIWNSKSFTEGTPVSDIDADSEIQEWKSAGKNDNLFPSRKSGYWYFTGWELWDGSDSTSDYSDSSDDSDSSESTLGDDNDIVYIAKFTPGKLTIPIDWNGADNESDNGNSLTCTWGKTYPDISPIPTLTTNTFTSISLRDKNTGDFIIGTHEPDTENDTAKGIALVSSEELGKSTISQVDIEESSEYPDFKISNQDLCVTWQNPILIYKVSFTLVESDGNRIVWHEKSYVSGTPINNIKADSDIQEWMAAGKATVVDFPKRSTGYWYFTGWDGAFPDGDNAVIENDIVFTAVFQEGKISISIKDPNNASYDESIVCIWHTLFPSIMPPISAVENMKFVGAELMGRNGAGDFARIIQTHNSSGNGVTYVDAVELGSGTFSTRTDMSGPVTDVTTCYLRLMWQDTANGIATLEDLRNAIDNIPSPFAESAGTVISFPKDSTESGLNNVNFEDGFPASYTTPLIDPDTGKVNSNARVITRKDFNTIGYMGTQEQFFAQCGGYHTFDEEVCTAIGGYPESAILRFFDEQNNCMRTVYSMVDNNEWNFLVKGVDGEHWKFIDNNHVLNIDIDYSDFIDLSNTLFVETGQADWYTVPYDAYLVMFALSCVDYHSISRNIDEEYADVSVGITVKKQENGKLLHEAGPYQHFDGNLFSSLSGDTFCDIYNVATNTTKSIKLRDDGTLTNGANLKLFGEFDTDKTFGVNYSYKMPRLVISQGNIFVSAGDKIRIRGVYVDTAKAYENSGYKTEKYKGLDLNDLSRINDRQYTDQEVRRIYTVKFANLYRVGWKE